MINEGKKTTILIVDDSEIIIRVLKHFFKDYNIELLTSKNGLEGIEMAEKYKPALIFLDIMMPNIDGIKVLQILKIFESIKKIPVIVISGNTNRENTMTSIEAGAERIMSKPLDKNVVIKFINEILGSNFLEKLKKTRIAEA